MTLFGLIDKQKNQILLYLWKTTCEELDDTIRILFFNHIRIHINRSIARKVSDYAGYEMKRYDIRHRCDLVIAEFHCSSCHSNFKYVVVSINSFISLVFNQVDKIVEHTIKDLTCKKCGVRKFEMTAVV
jgi:hypothetical protein